MIISFDLDDTLIANNKFDLEKVNVFQKLLKIERIRKGTLLLFKELRRRKHKIYIYTTSHRSISRIKWIFYTYGISVDYIINQQKHHKNISNRNFSCSKFPPMFNIDVHIDDSIGVEIEGEKFGFKTILISDTDEDWGQKILKSI
ncbi:hypothetical protein [Flavobacterium phragmitis]|uniref:HAD superfamily, subfamily IIIB (Acid phosphatase) n=1 Tax=Flavobacterium phragmitis TaxID=739143 RepID=A0A1I1W2G9_9FLAO|nr:hypothetical protein [Flavobacterium phragmitis]SFD89209.1 hypothetical protein SAMN05216297_11435 [Flavobacterium phragmitis]